MTFVQQAWRDGAKARRRARPLVALVALLCGVVAAPLARAKSFAQPIDDDEPPTPAPPPAPVSSTSFAGLFGLPSIEAALRVPDPAVQSAAVARAAEIATTAQDDATRDAAWKLVERGAMAGVVDDPDGSLLVRLTAVRALSTSTRPEARKVLDELLRHPEPPTAVPPPHYPYGYGAPTWPSPSPWGGPVPSPWAPYPPIYTAPKPPKSANVELARYVREAAAMALGRIGAQDALLARIRSHDDPIETGRAASLALAAYPAASIANLVAKDPPREDLELLDELRDPRLSDLFFRLAQRDDAETAAPAMLALARLDDGRVVPLAKAVASDAKPKLRLAAAEALAMLGEPAADAAIAALVTDSKLVSVSPEARRIAVRHPSPGLVPLIVPLATAGDAGAIAALGRVGAVDALATIARNDATPFDGADAAAYALAVMPGSKAEEALAAMLDGATAPRRRRALRAGAVRAARLDGTVSKLKDAAKSLVDAKDAADRAAATLFLATLDLGRAKKALASEDVVLRRAATSALLAHPVLDAAEVARAHLATKGASEEPDVVRALAAVAARAVDGSIARDVPISTAILAGWLSEGGSAAPLAAFLLAARGGSAPSPHVARALVSDSFDVRAAALLGLGASPDASATALLSQRALDLARPSLRRAAVRALAARGAAAGKKTLALVRALDADKTARALAASAAGPRTPLAIGDEVVQAKIGGASSTLATVVTADGLALPALRDPDGVLLFFRAPPGATRVEAAPAKAPLAAKPAPAEAAGP